MRLLTRSDFDGLACAALLKEVGAIDSIKFVHPKDIQDGLIEVDENDVLANVPYVNGCGLWFDHHTSENERLGSIKYSGLVKYIDSAAHVIYDYYTDAGFNLSKFDIMLASVDKVDSARLSVDEISKPAGWILLGFIMDPRTGLGRFRDFRISNYELMEKLIDACREKDICQILDMPDVKERIDLYHKQNALFTDMLKTNSVADRNVIITDLRGKHPIYTGNRFLIYNLFRQQNISVWAVDGKINETCSIAVGYSIINRTNTNDVGSILLSYGGGGHKQVGTCQVRVEDADRVISELREKLQ